MTLGSTWANRDVRAVALLLRLASRVRRRSARVVSIPVLTYHSVADDPWGSLDRYRIPTASFRLQMSLLSAAGLTVAPLGLVADQLAEGRSVSADVALSFDDGYADFYANALPVLRRHRFPATVFLVADRIGDVNRWEPDERDDTPRRPLMSWTEIRAAVAEGVDFQSHSCTHPKLSSLSPGEVEREIVESRRALERGLGSAVDVFCYPHGDASTTVRGQVQAAGYRAAFSTDAGLTAADQDRYSFKRVKVRPADSPLDLAAKLVSGRPLGLTLRQMAGRLAGRSR